MKFRMVDRIIDFVPQKSIRGVKTVSFEEYQLKSAFGGEPSLPETLIMESLFQLGNWLIMLSSDFSQIIEAKDIHTDAGIQTLRLEKDFINCIASVAIGTPQSSEISFKFEVDNLS